MSLWKHNRIFASYVSNDWLTVTRKRRAAGGAKYVQKKLVEDGNEFKIEALNGISYIIPQTVRIDNVDKSLDLYLRVRNVYDRVKLVIKADQETIK